MFSFDDKVMALALIRSTNLSKAVMVLARAKRVPAVTMREELCDLEKSSYLVDDGVVEITSAGTLQYVELHSPGSPIILTQEWFASCKTARQEAIVEALAILGAGGKLRSLKPYVVTKKVKAYETKKTGVVTTTTTK
jgi:hypothetical protein